MRQNSASLPDQPIAALRGASRKDIEAILASFAGRLKAHGLRVAGVVEVTTGPHADRGHSRRQVHAVHR